MTEVDVDRLRGLEAVLFLADHPLDVGALSTALDCDPDAVPPLLAELQQRLVERQSGLVLREVAGGWRLYTAAETREHVERHVLSGRQGRLSQAALETLAVIAYKQPISRTDVGDIRGVNADGAVRSLVARGLVEEVGRDDGPGQAVLYGTTTEFLEKVGMRGLDDLPSLTDFLVEDPAPDEPTPDQLTEARRRLQAGRDLPSTGAARFDPAHPDEGDGEHDPVAAAAARVREARRAAASRRREQDDEMDQLTDTLEQVAQNAMAQLRTAVSATQEDDDGAEQGDEEADTGDGDDGTGAAGDE